MILLIFEWEENIMKQKKQASFWESSFREEMENYTIEEGLLLWSLSGAVFTLRTPNALIYLDPYFGGDPVECAPYAYRTTQAPINPSEISICDGVLISHEHYDHCQEETLIPMVESTEANFYGPVSAVKEMVSFGIPQERIVEVKAGDTFKIKDAVITVCPAYDAYEEKAVTYLIEADGVKIFFGGDTSAGEAFDEIGKTDDLDIAILAFGRKWYMDEPNLLDAAERLKPKLLLPCHWDLWRAYTGDILELGRLVEHRQLTFETQVLLIGDYLHYKPNGEYIKGR